MEFNVGEEKAFAIIDFYDIHKNQEIMNDYAGGKYNILVTVYPSDNDQELNDYLENPNNRVMSGEKMKKKGSSQRGLGSYVPARLNDSPFFIDSIHQNEPIVNTSEEKNLSKEDQDLLFDDEFYESWRYESREEIVETVDELEMLKESEDFKELTEDEADKVNAKFKALKAGYSTIYDYYVETNKKRMLDDYAKNGEKSQTYRKLEAKRKAAEKSKRLSSDVSSATPLQNAQFEIIQSTNPMYDEYHTGIRSPKEIKTFAEVVDDPDSFTWGDFSKEDAQRALKQGSIEVYSSYPIENGVFVSTSYRQALDYAGGEASKVYSKTVLLDDVAWINGDEGQFAKVQHPKKYDLADDAADGKADERLNKAREYVKGFDNLGNHRRLAIIRMLRSSAGVDAETVKGIANLMAVIPSADLEIRFAEGIGQKGLFTKIGGKAVIVIDSSTERKKTIRGTIAHELTHYLEDKAGYGEFAKFVREHAKPEAVERHRKRYEEGYAALGITYTEDDIESEITASLVSDALQSETFLKRYAEKDKKFIQRVGSWLKRLVGNIGKRKSEASAEEREATKEAEAYAKKLSRVVDLVLQMPTTGESKSGVKYALAIHHSDGTIEELEDARSVTNEQALIYLKQAKKGELKRDSYIPVRSHTPQVIIDTMRQVDENVDDLSLVMQVKKAQQSMKVQNPGNRKTPHGSNVRNHALSPEDIVAIIDNLDNPQTIIYQTNRSDKYGNSLPNNIAVFVEYKNGETESLAIVEFNSSIDEEYINDDYGETAYHTVVTVFNPDTERNGIPYDYAEELLSNPDNIELELERGLSERSATGEKHPNTSSELPSKNSIPQKTDLSTPSVKKYDLADDDKAYMAAVESGDMETAQRMVDEAAKKAGYDIKGNHYTNAHFNVFDKEKIGSNSGDEGYFGRGFYFSGIDGFGGTYGNRKVNAYLKIERPLAIDELSRNEKEELFNYLLDNAPDEYVEYIVGNQEGERAFNNPQYSGRSFDLYDFDGNGLHYGYFYPLSQNISSWAQQNGYDGIYDGGREIVVFEPEQIKSADPVTYDDKGNVIPLSQRFNQGKPDIRYDLADDGAVPRPKKKAGKKADESAGQAVGARKSGVNYDAEAKKKITIGMSDSDRAEILKNKTILAPVYKGQADDIIYYKKGDLESGSKSLVEAAIVSIGEKFGVFVDYKIEDIGIQITLSKGNLRESISKETNPIQLAKLLPLLKSAVENSIAIESHANRYYFDNYTTHFDNLFGGYVENDELIPVRFGLKHGKGGEVVLYVIVDQDAIPLEKILQAQKKKAEVIGKAGPQITESSLPISTFKYSIPQIVEFVKTKDSLRYLPDEWLSEEQKSIKWEGIAETIQYTNNRNDKKYSLYISKGDLRSAKNMVLSAAMANGYVIDENGITARKGESIKSVEAITYDDNDTIIPISQRFNSNIGDVRYDLADDSSTVGEVNSPKRHKRTYAEGVLAGQTSQGRKDAPKLRKANEKLEAQKIKSAEKLVKYKASVSEREKKKRVKYRKKAKVVAERQMREKIAKENAEVSKAERAKTYTKQEVQIAVDSLEALTDVEVLSLAKGYELKGMTREKRDELVSKIYIALHEESARGETGLGSVTIKRLASKIAWDAIQSAEIKDEDGKSYHFTDIYDEASVQRFAGELTDDIYLMFGNMGEHTNNSYFQAELRALKENFRQERFSDEKIAKFAREVSYQGMKLRDIAAHQKREGVTEGLGDITKKLAAVVDPKGNIRVKSVDKAMREAAIFLEGEAMKTQSERDQLSPEARVSEVAEKMSLMMDVLLQAPTVGESKGETKYAVNTSSYYDFTKPFYQQIEDYKNGLFPQDDSLLLGETPEVFKSIGFNALPMTINQTHIDYALNGTKNADHEIGEVLLKYLPAALKKPVAVITSSTHKNTSVVAIVSITHNGNQINAAVYVDGTGTLNGIVFDSNAITSVYARKNAITKLLKDAIDDELNGKIGVYYWDKKRAVALLSGKKVTMPNTLNTLSDGSIHSIRENASPVKPKYENVTESQQFKRWFGDWKKHPNTASKVVNADGTPEILYHQTGEDFTVFDPRHKGAGTNDDETPFGIFMKPADNDIGLKGKKQMALYTRIVKPLVVRDRTELVKQLKAMSSKYAQLLAERDNLNAEYQKKIDEAGEAWAKYAREYRASHPDITRSELSKDAKPLKKNGFTIRYHAMPAEKIYEVIDNLDKTTAIIHQRNRIKKTKNGEIIELPDNFAVFVTLEDGKEYVAIIEFDAEINKKYIVEDGKGEKYHTTVTVFEPDVERDGEPFDYIEYLLLRGDNRELDIIEEIPESEAAIRQTEATASKKEISKNSIPQKSDLSTSSEKKYYQSGYG